MWYNGLVATICYDEPIGAVPILFSLEAKNMVRKFTRALLDDAVKQLNEGKSLTEIARKFSVSADGMSVALRKIGCVTDRRHKITRAVLLDAARQLDEGRMLTEIA